VVHITRAPPRTSGTISWTLTRLRSVNAGHALLVPATDHRIQRRCFDLGRQTIADAPTKVAIKTRARRNRSGIDIDPATHRDQPARAVTVFVECAGGFTDHRRQRDRSAGSPLSSASPAT